MIDTFNHGVVSRCTDCAAVERLLTRDYYDFPVCHFTPKVLRVAAKWIVVSKYVCFLIASADEQNAGFVFASTLGHNLWRRFVWENIWILPDVIWILAKLRFRGGRQYSPGHVAHALPLSDYEKVASQDLPTVENSFQWSKPNSKIGYIELLFVPASFRGKNLAPLLLRTLEQHMREKGVTRIEAHIDPGNYASIRAFKKVGWTVVKTSGTDFLAYIDYSESANR